MRIAYADPPYVGQAKKHYGMPEVDHEELIGNLEHYDGWALSCSSPSLHLLLPWCNSEVRVMAWVKPFAVFKPNVNPAYAWEPVLVKPARKRGREEKTTRDWVSASVTIKKGLAGAKPEAFSMWLFDVLGADRDDEFCDLFPGTGAVSKAWQKFSAQMVMVGLV